eukprot:TRINITY_DN6154_c0_g1_i2.p1 TRINITY_DN6154_c0_g1~~TRINITY_DN6154_c0_g1_i2.p1  ORF type:complete len:226 (+),score=70.15 TRINITY_DN6154_c0_g1_i2:75-752(+)
MPLHPVARQLYRQLLEVGMYHPTVDIATVREAARVEFYRRGQSHDPDMIKRAVAFGRKQLRHLKNGMVTYNMSRGGALEEDWKLANDRRAREALHSADGRVKYTPLRNVPRGFRGVIAADLRSAPLSVPERERRGLIGTPPTPDSVPALAASFDAPPAPTRLQKASAEITSASWHGAWRSEGFDGTGPKIMGAEPFRPENTVPFGSVRRREQAFAVPDEPVLAAP